MKREKEKNSNAKIPAFISDLMNEIKKRGLNEEGLFRLVGKHDTVSELKHLVNRGVDVNFSSLQINDMTSLLKKYLIELPTPLLTYNIYHKLIENGNFFKVFIKS